MSSVRCSPPPCWLANRCWCYSRHWWSRLQDRRVSNGLDKLDRMIQYLDIEVAVRRRHPHRHTIESNLYQPSILYFLICIFLHHNCLQKLSENQYLHLSERQNPNLNKGKQNGMNTCVRIYMDRRCRYSPSRRLRNYPEASCCLPIG